MGGAKSNPYFPDERAEEAGGRRAGSSECDEKPDSRIHVLVPELLIVGSSKPFFLWPL